MPLSFQQFNAKRNDILYWTEYGQTTVPTMRYLAAGMRAAADKLASQSRRQADSFRRMGDSLRTVSLFDDNDLNDRQAELALEDVNNLYAFLSEGNNRQILEETLAEHPELKTDYLRGSPTENLSFQEQLDAVGDFFAISQKGIDEQMERERREARLQGIEMRERQARERIRNQLKNVPEDQRAAEEQRLWQEYEDELRILEQGAEYARQQNDARQRREEEERQRQEEARLAQDAERIRREAEQQQLEEQRQQQLAEQRRLEEERVRLENQRKQQEENLRRQQEELRRTEGPFAIPGGYDYRDAAIHFTNGLKTGKAQDSPLFKLSSHIHARRLALEKEISDITAGVDQRLPPDEINYDECLKAIGQVPNRLVRLEARYGRRLNAMLERMPGDTEADRQKELYARMFADDLVRDARRADLMQRFPKSSDLKTQLKPHRAAARREILEKRFRGDLELRLRQEGNELAAHALMIKFFQHPTFKPELKKVLTSTFGAELQKKLDAYPGPYPENELFQKEIYEPALRDRRKWQELGNALGLPAEYGGSLIPNMDTMLEVARKNIRQEEIEEALFNDLVALHPEEALEDKAELAAEKKLYESLNPGKPRLDGDELLYDWARKRALNEALGTKQLELNEMKELDEAADALKQHSLAAAEADKGHAYMDNLTLASRHMKDTIIRLAKLEKRDPQLFRELAGELDDEWVKMDLMGSKEIRDAQKIPEQFLMNPVPKRKKSEWPIPLMGAGDPQKAPAAMEYKYHAFDNLRAEMWSDVVPDEEEELERNDELDYTFVDNEIPMPQVGSNATEEEKLAAEAKMNNAFLKKGWIKPVDAFLGKEWDKLGGDKLTTLQEKEKCLSRIVAADNLWLQGNEDPKEEEIDALAGKLRENGGFKQILDYVDPKIFARTRRTDLILKCMDKVNVSRAQCRLDNLNKLHSIAGPAVNRMLETRKGTSYFFGVSRFLTGNSTRYENALGAMQSVQHADPPDPKLVSDSVETVKEYLRDKMTVRDRAFGRVRWEQCMTFLKYAMPRKEFEAYCLRVNQARKAASPSQEGYVSPEMFGPPQTAGELKEEIMARIRAGEGTLHDYAVLGTMQRLNLKPEEQPDLTQLLENAKTLEDSADFSTVMALATPSQLLRMAEKDGGKQLNHCAEYTPLLRSGHKGPLPGLEEPVGPEKELLNIATEKIEEKEEQKEDAALQEEQEKEPEAQIIAQV